MIRARDIFQDFEPSDDRSERPKLGIALFPKKRKTDEVAKARNDQKVPCHPGGDVYDELVNWSAERGLNLSSGIRELLNERKDTPSSASETQA